MTGAEALDLLLRAGGVAGGFLVGRWSQRRGDRRRAPAPAPYRWGCLAPGCGAAVASSDVTALYLFAERHAADFHRDQETRA